MCAGNTVGCPYVQVCFDSKYPWGLPKYLLFFKMQVRVTKMQHAIDIKFGPRREKSCLRGGGGVRTTQAQNSQRNRAI